MRWSRPARAGWLPVLPPLELGVALTMNLEYLECLLRDRLDSVGAAPRAGAPPRPHESLTRGRSCWASCGGRGLREEEAVTDAQRGIQLRTGGATRSLSPTFDLGRPTTLVTRNGRQAPVIARRSSLRLRLGSQREGEGVQQTVGDSSDTGRRCVYPGCTTDLSVYNSDVLCWTHADEKTRAHFDRRSANEHGPRLFYAPRKAEPTAP
jgi:hypothetical protein